MTKVPTRTNPICNGMDFYKLELEVDPICKNAIRRVYINGRETVRPTYDAFGVGQGLIKMPQINLGLNNATGAQICLETTSPTVCNTLQAICPAHDGSCRYSIIKSGACDCCPVGPLGFFPPPPPIAFPYCRCNDTMGISPWRLADAVTRTTTSVGNMYTFTVLGGAPVDPLNTCAFTPLFKIEFWSNPICLRAVKNAYVNGVRVAPQWDKNGVWKVVKLNIPYLGTPGPVAQVALELDAKGPCPTLSQLCRQVEGKCVYSMFNPETNCCPIGYNVRATV
eukprot:CAMPEP_0202890518 /NCGR_PEP_ID=MMETSP1392-20130828/887_1 /ASSEMBLY_ACC=CAM_ASM_000868 /TAXON_ID=225041 /ORGANISM="Chlamydomonas chlamydogama, Strain SAG 11-48b" /LENGTH=279 /DNA_ID=CAMNT_0049574101 /DNA_START=430 /DNA_END=1269 /DNA_ORIENTATION=+